MCVRVYVCVCVCVLCVCVCVCVCMCVWGGGGGRGVYMRARYADCILLVPHSRIIIILAETVKHLPKTNPVMEQALPYKK